MLIRRIGFAVGGERTFSFSSRSLAEDGDLIDSRPEIKGFLGSMEADIRRLAAVAVGVTEAPLVAVDARNGVVDEVGETNKDRLIGGGPMEPSMVRFGALIGG